MGEDIELGGVAIVLGLLVGAILFVPFVAVSYRRRGALKFGRSALWGVALIYFWSIWTYTLLPLPSADDVRCAGVNLNLFEFTDDIAGAVRRADGDLRRALVDPAILQLVLNVLLFVPLGFFLRTLAGRGILIALLVGLGLSVFIETTQVTGVWGIYPCAYRVFDVDDMLTNSLGAVLGSVLSLVVPKRWRGSPKAADAGEPHPVTRGRRLLGMLCDALAFTLLSVAVGLATQLVLEHGLGQLDAVVEGEVATAVGIAVPVLVWFVVGLATGRTVGDYAVELRYRGGRHSRVLARMLRVLGGVTGYTLLDSLPDPLGVLALVFAVAALFLLFATRDARGLAGLLSGQALEDSRGP